MNKINKIILGTSLIFHGLVMTYLIYIYPILKFLFNFNALPYNWFTVFFLSLFGIYATIQLFERLIN